MAYHKDLIEQAIRLSELGRGRPKQANLRRAVSAVYYALFHLLGLEVERKVFECLEPVHRKPLRRIVNHSEAKEAARDWSKGQMKGFGPLRVPPDITRVADAFINLQGQRHRADYDMSAPFTKTEVRTLIQQGRDALAAWNRIRNTPMARLFLVSLFTYKRLRS